MVGGRVRRQKERMSTTVDRDPAHAPAPQRVELAIGGMTCASCAARIERTLNKLDGIRGTFATIESCQSTNNGGLGFAGASSTLQGNYANINQGGAFSTTGSSWSGNTLLGCGGPCQAGSGNLQLGPNNCDGVACP